MRCRIPVWRDVSTDDLIVMMQDEDELREQKEILEAMEPKLKEKFDQIRDLIETEFHTVLKNRYELGEHFQALYLDETNNGAKVYGKHAVDNICRLLGIDKSIVRSCMKFVALYSRDDLEMLCTRKLPRGEHVSWSHLRALVQVQDTPRREELLEKTFEQGWTCIELSDAIRNDHDHDNNSGRPLKVPGSFDAMIAQQKQVVEQFERRNQKVWSSEKHSLIKKAEELPEEEVTEDRLKQAAELAYQLRGLADEAVKSAEKAEAVVERFRNILSKRRADAESEDNESGKEGSREKKTKGKRKLAGAGK